MRHTPRVDEREQENEDEDEKEDDEETQMAEVSRSSAVVVQTAKVDEWAPMGTVPQVSAATFLTFLAITWAYRELYKVPTSYSQCVSCRVCRVVCRVSCVVCRVCRVRRVRFF